MELMAPNKQTLTTKLANFTPMMFDFSSCCCCFILLTLYFNAFLVARDYLSIHSVVAGGSSSLLQPNMHAYTFGPKFWHYHALLVNTKMEIKITFVPCTSAHLL